MDLRKLSFIVWLLLPSICFGQNKDNDPTEATTDVSKVTIINPGLSYEKCVGKFVTVYGQAFLNFYFSASYSSTFGGNVNFGADPALTVQPRYYYNYKRMEEKGRRTEMNSMNYLCVFFQSIFSKSSLSSDYIPETSRRPMNTIALCWGLQRNLRKRFSVDLNIGPGYIFTRSTTYDFNGQRITGTAGQFTFAGQFNVGFWLNRKRTSE